MKQLSHITLSALQKLLVSPKTRLTVTIEENSNAKKIAIAAMKKLRGSGNGNLIDRLLADRLKDKSNG